MKISQSQSIIFMCHKCFIITPLQLHFEFYIVLLVKETSSLADQSISQSINTINNNKNYNNNSM